MNDCSKHRKDVFGETDMKKVAEEIGDLHYAALFDLLLSLSEKIKADALKDREGDRPFLANALDISWFHVKAASNYIEAAWEISKRYMEEEDN